MIELYASYIKMKYNTENTTGCSYFEPELPDFENQAMVQVNKTGKNKVGTVTFSDAVVDNKIYDFNFNSRIYKTLKFKTERDLMMFVKFFEKDVLVLKLNHYDFRIPLLYETFVFTVSKNKADKLYIGTKNIDSIYTVNKNSSSLQMNPLVLKDPIQYAFDRKANIDIRKIS